MHLQLAKYFFIVCLAFPVLINAQSFRYNQYTTYEGLPIDNVYATAQDDDGYMWFATDFGISKYDGFRFQNYNRNNGIATKAITDIVYAGGDSCIFLAYPTTLQSIHSNGKIVTLATFKQFALGQIIRHNNDFYFYQRNKNMLGVLQQGKISVYNVDSLLNEKGIIMHAVISYSNYGIGISTNKGLFILNNGNIIKLLADKDVYFSILSKNKTIYAVANQVLLESDNNFNFIAKGVPITGKENIYNMVADQDGVVWLRGLEKGVYRYENGQLDEMSATLNLQNKIVNEFFVDKQNNTWMCTDGSGILFKKKKNFTNYETQDGLANNKVLRLIQNDNKLFIGTANGISVKDGDAISVMPLPLERAGLRYVSNFFNTSNNSVGTNITNTFPIDTGIKATKNIIKTYKVGDYTLAHIPSQVVWQQDSSTYWIADNQSAYKIVGNNTQIKYSYNQFQIRKAYDTKELNGVLYVGTTDGLVVIKNSRATCIKNVLGKSIGEVINIFVDSKKQIWFATDIGLMVLKNENYSFAPSGNTFGSNYCRSITEDDEGKIWCATWDGIFVTDGNTRTNYSTNVGIISKTCNAILYDAIKNALYIGTDNGLSVIDKKFLQEPTLFQKTFINCSTSDSIIHYNDCYLNSDQNNLQFYLSIPYYGIHDDLVYEYKLDNGNWQQTANPNFFLSEMSSGNHKLYARALIKGTVITKETAIFSFNIKQRFYKTWWFLALILAVLQFFILKLINRYNKKVRERKEAIQKQQNELAALKQQAFTSLMNPHFIFNALNSIQHYINKQDRQTANKYLSNFATLVRRNFDSANKPYVLLDEEVETIKLYLELEKMRFHDKFDYSITLNQKAEDEDWLLPGMVIQPFLENAILHGIVPSGKKGQLNIHIEGVDNKLIICITDNGIGMAKSKLLKMDTKHNSRGMQLIKDRLEILSNNKKEKVQLIITNLTNDAENPGTKIDLIFPQEVYESGK